MELGRLPAANERLTASTGGGVQLISTVFQYEVPVQIIMPFVGDILSQLKAATDIRILQEIRDGQMTGVTGGELLELVSQARTFRPAQGLKKTAPRGLPPLNTTHSLP